MTKVYLALGANVGNKKANIKNAVAFLKMKISEVAIAPLYKTKPWG